MAGIRFAGVGSFAAYVMGGAGQIAPFIVMITLEKLIM